MPVVRVPFSCLVCVDAGPSHHAPARPDLRSLLWLRPELPEVRDRRGADEPLQVSEGLRRSLRRIWRQRQAVALQKIASPPWELRWWFWWWKKASFLSTPPAGAASAVLR